MSVASQSDRISRSRRCYHILLFRFGHENTATTRKLDKVGI